MIARPFSKDFVIHSLYLEKSREQSRPLCCLGPRFHRCVLHIFLRCDAGHLRRCPDGDDFALALLRRKCHADSPSGNPLAGLAAEARNRNPLDCPGTRHQFYAKEHTQPANVRGAFRPWSLSNLASNRSLSFLGCMIFIEGHTESALHPHEVLVASPALRSN
jgi:hypothetical protein